MKQAPYRGRRIPILKLAELFDYAASSKPGSQQVLVVNAEGLTFGLLVDAVEEVVEVDPREIQPMPGMATLLNPAYFRGLFLWKGRIAILLDERGLAKLEAIVRFDGGLMKAALEEVVEIIEYKEPTRTPKRPPFVEGVIEHRGQVMPLISLRKRLGAQEVTHIGSAVLLLKPSPSDQVVGLLVDAASKVIAFERKAILEPPPKVFGIRAEFIKGIATLEGRPVIWLDVPRLLSSQEEIALV